MTMSTPPPRPILCAPPLKGMGARVTLSGAVRLSFTADAMLAAVFRVALRAFGERARFLTLPGPGFRQVQLDADFLRQVCVCDRPTDRPMDHVFLWWFG